MLPVLGMARAARAAMVGRQRDIEVVAAALAAGRSVVLEGPPGTGKTTLLRALASGAGVPLVLVEGNAELTPARLVGHHDPSRVLSEGYHPGNFVPGPLLDAMTGGGLLYVEELNRVPEETLNVLLGVLSERRLQVPRVGELVAAQTFRLVAAMNPFDAVGTGRISPALYDRSCRVAVGYQTQREEEVVVARQSAPAAMLVRRAVRAVRATRDHPDLRVGSSVRGAIDLVAVAGQLRALRGAGRPAAPGPAAPVPAAPMPATAGPAGAGPAAGPAVAGPAVGGPAAPVAGAAGPAAAGPAVGGPAAARPAGPGHDAGRPPGTDVDEATGLDAALAALSGRVTVREGSARTAEEIVAEIWRRAAPADPVLDEAPLHDAATPDDAGTPGEAATPDEAADDLSALDGTAEPDGTGADTGKGRGPDRLPARTSSTGVQEVAARRR